MTDPIQAPLEAIARELGRLLKCYSNDVDSATDFLGLLSAFREGFYEVPDGPAEIRLPLLTRAADPERAIHETFLRNIDHDAAAVAAVHLEVGPDYVEVKHKPTFDPATGKPMAVPAVTCFIDHSGRLTVDLWHAGVGSSRRYVLREQEQS